MSVTAIKDFTKYNGMISNSGHDENNAYKNGKPGDQTGSEWLIRPWYNRPWGSVIRFKDNNIAAMFSTLEIYAAQNNNVGYNQLKRTTYYVQLKKVSYDPRKITVKCDDDCSAGIMANVKAALYLTGHKKEADMININCTTWNLEENLKSTGLVTVYNAHEYVGGYAKLQPGDILLNKAHHVCAYIGGKFPTATTTQTKKATTTIKTTNNTTTNNTAPKTKICTLQAAKKRNNKYNRKYTVIAKSGLNLRYGADKDKYDFILLIPYGATVYCYGFYNLNGSQIWLYVAYQGKTGYVSLEFLK